MTQFARSRASLQRRRGALARKAEPETPRNPLARSGAVLAVATVVAGVLGYVYILVLTRALGPVGDGVLGSLLGLSVVLSIASTALQLEATRAVAIDPSAPRGWLHRRGIAISFATGALTLLATPLIDAVLRLPTPTLVFALAAVMLPQTYVGVQLGILLGAGRTGAFSLLLVVSGASRTAAAVLTAVLHQSPAFALWVSAATGVATNVIGALLIRRLPRPHLASDHPPIGWSGFLRAALGAGALIVLLNADLLTARAVLPDKESGWYAFLTVFGRVTFWGTNFVALWVFPHEAARESAAKARAYALTAVAVIATFAVASSWLAGDVITDTLAGPEYAGAAGYAPWFAVAGSLLSVVQLATYVDVARGRRRLSLVVWAASPAMVLAIWLAPHTIAGVISAAVVILTVVAAAGVASMRRPAAR